MPVLNVEGHHSRALAAVLTVWKTKTHLRSQKTGVDHFDQLPVSLLFVCGSETVDIAEEGQRSNKWGGYDAK